LNMSNYSMARRSMAAKPSTAEFECAHCGSTFQASVAPGIDLPGNTMCIDCGMPNAYPVFFADFDSEIVDQEIKK